MNKDILDTLRFIRGAVSTKNLLPELQHYVIKDGFVRGFNGNMALGSPIDFDVSCAPRAVPLVQAIQRCGDVTSLAITEAQRLRVQSGKFKAFIECVDLDGLPIQAPEGDVIPFDGASMLKAVEKLTPFIGNDASRPWTNGILLRGQSAFATNNVCLVEYWVGSTLPFTVNIPVTAIKEMSRIGEPPLHAQLSNTSITFHYADDRWLRTQLYETSWPDLSKVLDRVASSKPVPTELFEALSVVKPFIDKGSRVYFRGGAVTTSQVDGDGASHEVEGLASKGIFNINMLQLLDGVADTVDFEAYPEPMMFYGDRLRGAIVGLL